MNGLTVMDWFFLGAAACRSEKSRDPSTKVGVVLVRPFALAFLAHNHFPTLEFPELATREERYADVVHAEQAVLEQAGPVAAGATVYCTHEPCGACWKRLVRAGVSRVVFRRTGADRRERWECEPGRRFALACNLQLVEVP